MNKFDGKYKYYQSIKKLVGISSSCNSNDLGCPCEVTLWVTLQGRPCLHSGLLMPTLVDEPNLSEVSFNKVYWFRMKNWLCSFLVVKEKLMLVYYDYITT